jgi:hypothetical protein
MLVWYTYSYPEDLVQKPQEFIGFILKSYNIDPGGKYRDVTVAKILKPNGQIETIRFCPSRDGQCWIHQDLLGIGRYVVI